MLHDAPYGVNDDFGRGGVAEFEKQMTALGATTVMKEYFEHGNSDFYTLLTKLKRQCGPGKSIGRRGWTMLMRVKGVKPVTVRKGGKVYRYYRHRATGQRIKAEFGTAAFAAEAAARPYARPIRLRQGLPAVPHPVPGRRPGRTRVDRLESG